MIEKTSHARSPLSQNHFGGRNLQIIGGSNFTGRSRALEQFATRETNSSFIKPRVNPSITGFVETARNEIMLHCAGSTNRWQLVSQLAQECGLDEVWDQNPFKQQLSGGQECLVATLAKFGAGHKRLAIDVCVEQLDTPVRRKLYQFLDNNSTDTRVKIVDNRLGQKHWEMEPDNENDMEYDRRPEMSVDPLIASNAIECMKAQSLVVEALKFHYPGGKDIFGGFSLGISPGVCAITGPNGSGKTTLARLLIGRVKAQSGNIYLGGKKLVPYLKPGQLAAYAFQEPFLQFTRSTVDQELPRSRIRESVIDAFGLRGLLELHPLDLPWVLQKRLSIAMAVARETPWTILDEPTLGQDDTTVAILVEQIKYLCKCGRSILVISHNDDFVQGLGAQKIKLET